MASLAYAAAIAGRHPGPKSGNGPLAARGQGLSGRSSGIINWSIISSSSRSVHSLAQILERYIIIAGMASQTYPLTASRRTSPAPFRAR